jgi:hypothetical protein
MVRKFTRLSSIVLILLCAGNVVFGQTIQSSGVGTGAWNDPASWTPATVPTPANSTLVEILNGHTINVTANTSVDQTVVRSGGSLIVNGGVTFTLNNGTGDEITVDAGGDLTNNGVIAFGGIPVRTLVVNGDMNNSGTFSSLTSAKLIFGSGSNYYHQYADGGTIPAATWNSNSTVNIIGYTSGNSTPPTGLSQTFGNFVWNAPGQDVTIVLGGLPSSINGDFRVENTGIDALFYSSGGAGNTMNIGGDLVVTGGVIGWTSGDAGPSTINVSGDLLVSSGYVQLADDQDLTINVTGAFSLSGDGQIEFSASSAITTINLQGNYTHTDTGDMFVSGGQGTINFTGSSTKIYTSNIVPSGAINYSVASLSTLQVSGSDFIGGNGTFTLSGRLQLGSVHAGGALQNGTANGNLRIPTANRTFNVGSSIEYNGAGAQFIGNGFPSSDDVNLTIDNASGVTLSDDLEIVALRTLTLQNGNLNIGTQTLTINGTITGTGGLVGGPTSNLVIGGTGNFGTLTFNGTSELLDFTINRDGGLVTLGADLTVIGTFDHLNGDIDFSDRTLRISGAYTATFGEFIGNDNSTMIIDGAGTITGGIPISGSVGTFTLSRSAGATIGAISVSNQLNLTSGTLTGDVEFPVQTPTDIIETLNRGNGALSGTLTATLYNLLYSNTGAISTGPELVDENDALNNFTVSGSSTVNLTEALEINGDFTKTNGGTFNSANLAISLAGNYSKTGGTTTYGTTVFTFAGNTTISGTGVNFSNVQIANGATLNLGSASVTYTGNFNHDSGGTMVAGTGTSIFGGNTTLTFNGSNVPNFNNVTISAGSTLAFSCGTCGNIVGNDTNLNAVTLSGIWNSNNAGAVFTPSEARVQLIGNNQTVQTLSGHSFFTLELNGTGTNTLVQALSVDNDLLVGTTATLNTGASSFAIEIGDDFIINGSFVSNTGTVFFNGSLTGNQNLNRTAGSAATIDFYNIHIDKTDGSFSVLATVPNTIFRVNNEFRIVQNSAATTDIDFDGSTNAGSLVLVSNNSITARIPAVPSGVATTGNLTVQRYVQNDASVRDYRYITSPVSGATVADWQGEIAITGQFSNPSTGPGIVSSSPSLYRWVETAGGLEAARWQPWPNNVSNPASSFSLENGRGYAVYVRNTGNPVIDVRGTLNVGNVNVPLTITGSEINAAGYNLVGNPYPAPINWDDMALPTGVSPVISLKNNVNNADTEIGNYVYYTQDGPNVGGFTGVIASGQAFWVNTSQNATLQFTESVKATTANPILIRKGQIANVLRIKVQGNGREDETVAYFRDEATNGFDYLYDAKKRNNDHIDLYSYALQDNDTLKYAINAMVFQGCSQEIKLGFDQFTTGTYHFTFSELESFSATYAVTLIDNFTGSSVSVQDGDDYTFQITGDEASKSKDRFTVLISNDNISTALAVTGDESCNPSTLKITLPASQTGITYQPYLDGLEVGEAIAGTGGLVELPLEAVHFAGGNTYEVSVKAYSACAAVFLAQKAMIEVSDITPVEISTAGNTLISNYESGNTWYYEGAEIQGATGKELNATKSGLYKLTVTTEGGCTSFAEYMFLITDTENPLSKSVTVYANPFVNHFRVEVTASAVVETKVRNSAGMLIAGKTLEGQGPVKSGEYDMTSFSDGMYILEIRVGDMIHSVKIIKGL